MIPPSHLNNAGRRQRSEPSIDNERGFCDHRQKLFHHQDNDVLSLTHLSYRLLSTNNYKEVDTDAVCVN